eukprot:gene39931-17121_t
MAWREVLMWQQPVVVGREQHSASKTAAQMALQLREKNSVRLTALRMDEQELAS